MRRPRISIAGLMVLIAVLAVDWVVMRNGMAVSERANRHGLFLCYSWVPDRLQLPKDEPVFAQYVEIFNSDLSEGLALLVVGTVPMVSLLGLGCVILLRNLALQGRCSPFLLGFVVSGTAVLACFVVCCLLATECVERCGEWVLYLPLLMFRGRISNDLWQAINFSAATLVLGLPQVLIALLGGKLNERKLRVALVVMPRTETDSEAAIVGGGERPTGF